jgi:hypothetical protein
MITMPKKQPILSLYADVIFNKKSYQPGDVIACYPKIWNSSKKQLRVTKYYVWFDWLKTKEEKERCAIHVTTKISGKKGTKPKGKSISDRLITKVPMWVDAAHHSWSLSFNVDLKTNGDWESIGRPSKTKPDKILVTKSPQKNYKIFVSHRICPKDKALVDRIVKIFRNNGFEAFAIEKNPQTNPNLWDEIEEQILTSQCFLLVWTKSAANKPGEIREELGKAKLLQRARGHLPIFCLSETKNVPSSISDIKHTPLNRAQMNKSIEEVLESITTQYKTEKKRKK